jgi:hypothetical protein
MADKASRIGTEKASMPNTGSTARAYYDELRTRHLVQVRCRSPYGHIPPEVQVDGHTFCGDSGAILGKEFFELFSDFLVQSGIYYGREAALVGYARIRTVIDMGYMKCGPHLTRQRDRIRVGIPSGLGKVCEV